MKVTREWNETKRQYHYIRSDWDGQKYVVTDDFYTDERATKVGWRERHYLSGNLREKSFYAKGLIEGTKTTFYDVNKPSNTVIKEKIEYVHGIKSGDYTQYDQDTQTTKESCQYVNGRIDGIYWKYYHDGKKREVTQYLKGKKHGWDIKLNAAENVISMTCYYEDRILDDDMFDWQQDKKTQLLTDAQIGSSLRDKVALESK